MANDLTPKPDPTGSNPREDTQRTKDLRETEKLELEIQNLSLKNRWEARTQLMPIVATILAIAGFFFTVIQFQCGRRAEQQKDRNSREAEQQKDRNLKTAEQLSRCQSQLRTDTEALIKSGREGKQTASEVFFLLEDARAALACKVNETQTLGNLFPNYERALSESLVRLVRDDYDFTNSPRDVSLANAIADQWVDYKTYLKTDAKALNYILYKYTNALQDLGEQNRGYMKCLDVDKETKQVTVCDKFDKRKNQAELYNHFADLVAGFQEHAELLDEGFLDAQAIKRRNKIRLDFQEAICNRVISEHFLGTFLSGGECK